MWLPTWIRPSCWPATARCTFSGWRADAPQERATSIPWAAPLRVVFSPSGSAAALYSPGSVKVIKGLPDAPVVAATIRVRVNPRSRRPLPETLAVSDDGAYLLYSAGGPVELIGVAGDSRKVLAGATGALAAFAPGSHDAAIVYGGKLILYQDIAGQPPSAPSTALPRPARWHFRPTPRSSSWPARQAAQSPPSRWRPATRSALACDCAPARPDSDGFRLPPDGAGQRAALAAGYRVRRGLVFVCPLAGPRTSALERSPTMSAPACRRYFEGAGTISSCPAS